jgi:hypothetical protein
MQMHLQKAFDYLNLGFFIITQRLKMTKDVFRGVFLFCCVIAVGLPFCHTLFLFMLKT